MGPRLALTILLLSACAAPVVPSGAAGPERLEIERIEVPEPLLPGSRLRVLGADLDLAGPSPVLVLSDGMRRAQLLSLPRATAGARDFELSPDAAEVFGEGSHDLEAVLQGDQGISFPTALSVRL